MTECPVCKQPRVVTLAHEVTFWKRTFKWSECVDCFLRAEGKRK